MGFRPEVAQWGPYCIPLDVFTVSKGSSFYKLRKTIKGYVFYFDFTAKGIFFSIQIINRYVAEPSLCKHSIFFCIV